MKRRSSFFGFSSVAPVVVDMRQMKEQSVCLWYKFNVVCKITSRKICVVLFLS